MKGYTLTICMPLVAAILLWFGFQQPSLPPPPLATTSNDSKLVPLDYEYPVVKFTTVDATGKSYGAFIKELRNRLVTGEDLRHEIPVLRRTVDIGYRFILVELTNQQGVSVTLAVDVINVYVVGYRAGNYAAFFRPESDAEREAIDTLFVDQSRQTLGYTGSYIDLERDGGSRADIPLGLYALDNAISVFDGYATGRQTDRNLCRSFIVCIQMISEAARFEFIRVDIGYRFGSQDRVPDARILSLENNWGSLSQQVQTSNDEGVFIRPVRISRSENEEMDVDNARRIARVMGVMLYRCADPRINYQKSRDYESNEDACACNEPTVRISGPNGLCADVNQGRFDDGNSIILYPCQSNTSPNQFWTLKGDGTIRSNGKCLSTYGNNPGFNVMIYDCGRVSKDRTRWEVWDNGTITNPASGLVLAANSWDQGTTLSLETNVYTTSQSWQPTNSTTQPFVASIVGYEDLCLEGNGENVWVDECIASKREQHWALYPDGSIRPQQNQQNCLTADGDTRGNIVKILYCQLGSATQRWEFKNDGSIWNLISRLVLDVKQSDPSLKQIIIWTDNHGAANQKWNIMY
ncbi:ricin-like [Mercurialis annua]|uniref:ricin-like n=1 Tax=Mercurialis annua TaxID=3986 RepID=UPI00215F1C33|nr:ricin-like [Mercurialis annua]